MALQMLFQTKTFNKIKGYDDKFFYILKITIIIKNVIC